MFYKTKFIYLFLILFFILYVLKGATTLDPDFGWHLKMGELIIHNGIPKTDPFSYTMPGFPFIDHEWLTNAVIAFLLPKIGIMGLSVVFAILLIAALFIVWQTINKDEKTYSLIPLILTGITFTTMSGLRPQVITLFFLALQFFILKNHKGIKQLFFLCLLFLFWVNLHGGFAVGIFVLLFFFASDMPNAKKKFLTLCVCTLITFINPYGLRIWEEVWRQYSDSSLHWYILEWQPALFFAQLSFFGFWIFLVLSVILFLRYRQIFSRSQIYIFLTFLFASISSVRNTTLWMVASTDIFTKGIYSLSKEAEKYKYGRQRFKKTYWIFVVVCCLAVLMQAILQLKNVHIGQAQTYYPEKEVVFLQNHLPAGNIFSTYNWGGYLIWKLPQKKVFIDGRMPSWKRNEKIPNQSNNAFADYQEILLRKKALQLAIQKYGIKTFVLPRRNNNSNPAVMAIYSFIVKAFHWNMPDYILYKELEKEGFKKVFQTETGIIYEK